MHVQSSSSSWIGYAIAAAIIAIVFAFRLRGLSRSRPLRVERLWILPVLYAALVTTLYVMTPPAGFAWLGCIAALAVGCALGWQRGKLMRIEIDPESHALNMRQSPAGLIFILLLVALRSGSRAALAGGTGTFHLTTATLTDVLLAFALGFIATQRIEMYLRAKRLLEDARGFRT